MNRDYKKFPEDDNGEVLWKLRCAGDALTAPREIDFDAVFPTKKVAEQFADLFRKDHRIDLEQLDKDSRGDDGLDWHVIVYLDEVPTHERICEFEALMENRATKLGGRTWGWSANFVPSADPIPEDIWWQYTAGYEDNLPGSIRINLALKDHAPVKGFPKLVIARTGYESNPETPENKLPSTEELDLLHSISEQRVALITSNCEAIYIGGFLCNNWQEDFFYATDVKGLEAAVKKFHQAECPGRKTSFSTHDDPKWKHYLEFLYPNEATIKFYKKDLKKLGVL